MSWIVELVRSLRRQFVQSPFLSSLNLFGLAAGCAAGAVILLYARAELNFDSWVPNQERLYVVEGQFLQSATGGFSVATMAPLQPAIEANIAEVVESTRLYPTRWPVQNGDFVDLEIVSIADTDFFSIFPVKFLAGDAQTAWSGTGDVVLSESMAIKYFGSANVVGETLTLNGDTDYRVGGVFADLPTRSDIYADILVKARDGLIPEPDSWSAVSMLTFAKLDSPESAAIVNQKLALLVDTHRPFLETAEGEMKEFYRLYLQPFGDYHLGSRGRSAANSIGNFAALYGYIAVAILILVISAFNYVGLATAQGLEREKEICLRKVLGGDFRLIARSTLAESAAQAVIAALIGLLLVEIAIPFFNAAMNYDLAINELLRPLPLTTYFLGAALLGLIAGIYPAFFVAAFRPIRFLSGGRSNRAGAARVRQLLVFLQFSAAIGLIIGAATISRQIALTNRVDMGFDQGNLMLLRGLGRSEVQESAEALRTRMSNLPGVVGVTRSSVAPMDNSSDTQLFYSASIPREEAVGLREISVDYNFWDTYRVPLVAGRSLEERYAEDEFVMDAGADSATLPGNRNVVLNAEAVRQLGFADPSDSVGQQIQLFMDDGGAQFLTVVGVIDDILFESARIGREAKIFYHNPRGFRVMALRIDPRWADVQDNIRSVWQDMFPGTPVRMDLLEDRIALKYAGERQQLELFVAFSTLAVLLAALGLVGLILNSVARRTKEISLRKVLGASSSQVIHLFAWQYLRPVLIANIPAWAVASYYANEWLRQYAMRVDLSVSTYVLAGATVAFAALTIVTILVMQFARTSPAVALRHE